VFEKELESDEYFAWRIDEAEAVGGVQRVARYDCVSSPSCCIDRLRQINHGRHFPLDRYAVLQPLDQNIAHPPTKEELHQATVCAGMVTGSLILVSKKWAGPRAFLILVPQTNGAGAAPPLQQRPLICWGMWFDDHR
jgi:hypothetical protein